jgi:hypothetical protein
MNFRDVEQLSAYLDGQLSPSDSARLKSRLSSEPDLVTILDSLRESRSILRQLPHRRAPRNFLLTPKMVGRKPPLPRTYPVFRFATALATLLFGLSFLTSQVGRLAANVPQAAYGIGGGGGGSDVVTEAPAMEAPAPETTMIQPPASPEPVPQEQKSTMEGQSLPAVEAQAGETPSQPLLNIWQMTFLAIAVLGAFGMFLIQRFAARKWHTS